MVVAVIVCNIVLLHSLGKAQTHSNLSAETIGVSYMSDIDFGICAKAEA